MIGISIYSDSLRAVRIKQSGGKVFLKQCYEAPLYENTIVNGELRSEDNFLLAINEIKENMQIDADEEVSVGLPNGICKIDSLFVKSDVINNDAVINQLGAYGNREAFDVRFLFVSGDFKISQDDFDSRNLSSEEKSRRIEKRINEDHGQEDAPQKFVSVRSVSYVAIPKVCLETYFEAFKKAGLNIVSAEPNAVATLRYLREDAAQPFMVVDTEYDYVSYIVFSERDGALMMTATDIGLKYFEVIRPSFGDSEATVSINHLAIGKFSGRMNLAMDMFAESSLSKEAKVEQVIFLNGELDYLIDAAEQNENIDVLLAESMYPSELSEKKLDEVMPEAFYLYYIPIVLCGNKMTNGDVTQNVSRQIEVDFLPEKAREDSFFRKIRANSIKTAYALAGTAAAIFVAVVVYNGASLLSIDKGEEVPDVMRAKYEEAVQQSDQLRDNISKYNAIATHRATIVPILDAAVSARPDDVFFTSLNIQGKSAKNKKIVIECMTQNSSSPTDFLMALQSNAGFERSKILSQETKNNRTAFQIVVPLDAGNQNKDTAKKDRENLRNNKKDK